MEKRDPIDLLKEKMISQKIVSDADVERLTEVERKSVEEAVEFARTSPFPGPEQLFEDMWTDPID